MHQRDKIAASVVLGFCFISIMVVVARFFWAHHRPGKDQSDSPSELSVNPIEQETSLLSRDRFWMKLLTPKRERGQWVPTLSGILKAGDEGIYSSALFNSLHGHPGEILLETIHEAFAKELRSRPAAERSAYPSEISKFLSSARRPRRGQSLRVSKDGRPELPPRPSRNSIDLAEMGLSRSRSRRMSPVLISTFNNLPFESGGPMPAHGMWSQDLQHALYFEGRAGVKVSPRELAALSIVLGSTVELAFDLKDNEKPTERRSSSGRGAFSISLSGERTSDGNYRIFLKQHKRSIPQLPARGSGYSTLHAKHMSCGSLAFSSDRKAINSILITNDTLEALKSGTRLHLQKSTALNPASKFLASLPHSREPHFHILTPSTTSTSTPRLLDAIAALPFTGGLTPLASTPIIQTVQFIASGGLAPGRLLQRLEALVDKVHHHSPSLQLFGPLLENSNAGLLFRERERLGKFATGGSIDETLADKAARMHRYITLLERLMCLVPDMKPHDVLAAVREATKKEIARSYEDAVAAYVNKDSESATTAESKRLSGVSRRGTRRSKRSSISATPLSSVETPTSPASGTSPRPSSTFPLQNLGRQVEDVLKGSLPFDVQTVALVARMVLVAWTLSVERVAWEEGEEGFRVLEVSKVPENMYMW